MDHSAVIPFPTTHWSLVAKTGANETNVRHAALEALLRRYLMPLRTYLITRRRIERARADDLLQDFIADKILAAQLIPRADRERGRFRTFLLTALERFVSNRLRDEAARQKHLGGAAVSLDATSEPSDGPDPAREFEISWAKQVLADAVERTRNECADRGRSDVWEIFRMRVLEPILEGAAPVPYEKLATQFGLTESSASNLLITAKRMFARNLRALIGEYELGESSVDAEISELYARLSREGATRA